MSQELPILAFEQGIVSAVRDNQVVVVAAETGAGKSTQVPRMLLRAGFGAKGLIGITEPRRVAAMTVASYVAELEGVTLGDKIGYQIRNDRRLSAATRVKFMTEGILLRELHSDPELRRYEVVIVDEAHERGINQDLILALLKRTLPKRPDLKVIVMSATIDEQRFADYFSATGGSAGGGGGAPIIKVPGRVFPVEIRYATETPSLRDAPKACALRAAEIIRRGEKGDILIFLPDERTIKQACKALEDEDLPGILILPLYGQQSPDEQREVFRRGKERRVIVATNIAETSITIDGVVHVVDSGLIKATEYISASMSALRITEHSRAGCDQRAGRAGRTQPGICHRIFPRDEYDERPAYLAPEIRRTALDQLLLHLLVLGYAMDEIKSLEFMDPPGEARWEEAEARLKLLGALDHRGKVTKDGERMEALPVAPVLGRMLLTAESHGCVREVATIVAALSGTRQIFVRPRGKEKEAEQAHFRFKVPTSDALTTLKVFHAWQEAGQNGTRSEWARDNFVSARALREVEQNREQLLDILAAHGIRSSSNSNEEVIRKAVAAGLVVNLCLKQGRYDYAGAGQYGIYIYPGSALFGTGPRILVCATLYESTGEKGPRIYARDCTAIEASWLPDIIPIDECEVALEVRRSIFRGDEPELVKQVRWRGQKIGERIITTLEDEDIALLAMELVRETLQGYGYSATLHPQTVENREVWKVIAGTHGISFGFLELIKVGELVKTNPEIERLWKHFGKCLLGAQTLAEVRGRDIRLRLEDWVPADVAAAHRARLEEEHARHEEERRHREAEAKARREEDEERRRVKEAEEAPLKEYIAGLKERLTKLAGPEASRLRYDLGQIEYQLGWEGPDRIRRKAGAIESQVEKLERDQKEAIELMEQGWSTILADFPACPLCGGAWEENGMVLRCGTTHSTERLIPLGDEGRGGLIGRWKTNRDEEMASARLYDDDTIVITIRRSRGSAWEGKKWKTLQYEPETVILPLELVPQRAEILRDLAELRGARDELEATLQRIKEAERRVGAGAMKRLTFEIVGGQTVAIEGGQRYVAAYAEVYPARGETWFCRIGRTLTAGARSEIEVHPEFKAGSISSAADLEELRSLLRETYPGLPDELLFVQ